MEIRAFRDLGRGFPIMVVFPVAGVNRPTREKADFLTFLYRPMIRARRRDLPGRRRG
jgi:hypothetical protein